jgi:leucyl aminopeptidase
VHYLEQTHAPQAKPLDGGGAPWQEWGMTEFTDLLLPDHGQDARTIAIITKAGFEDWLAVQAPRARTAAATARFLAKPGELLIVPGEGPEDWSVALGAPEATGLWDLAGAASRLPASTYRLAEGSPGLRALGWLLSQHHFDRYLAVSDPAPVRVLLTSDPASIAEIIRVAQATALVRDMVNTPAEDMGPADIEAEAATVAKAEGAMLTVTRGDALAQGYPLVHAVGRAAAASHAPRMIELEWGDPANPRLAIIGKGVAFDSGGLDIKPPSGMRTMKKDMGGAAHALGLAKLVMAARLPVRLHMLIPAVENAIAGNAFRPGDIVKSRNGMTVEIDNTDAEGRLVLADAITKAAEGAPVLIIDFATLTGAARTALGPDLPALFANDHDLAAGISNASVAQDDPVWRLPLWRGYNDMLKSDIADIANSSDSGMAGAITAALFLQKFIPNETEWAHLDTFAWRSAAKPGRPKGGEALGMRAVFAALKARYPVV